MISIILALLAALVIGGIIGYVLGHILGENAGYIKAKSRVDSPRTWPEYGQNENL